ALCVVAPITCFGTATYFAGSNWMDLGDLLGPQAWAFDVYAVIMAATATRWLAVRSRSPNSDAFAAGAFLGGAIFALPWCVCVGLMGAVALAVSGTFLDLRILLLASLGFAPIPAALTFAINSSRARRTSMQATLHPLAGLAATAALPLAIAVVISFGISSVED